MNRDQLLAKAIEFLAKAKEAGGYLGYEPDVQEAIKDVERIRARCNKPHTLMRTLESDLIEDR